MDRPAASGLDISSTFLASPSSGTLPPSTMVPRPEHRRRLLAWIKEELVMVAVKTPMKPIPTIITAGETPPIAPSTWWEL
jgi:hypothetical protein